VRRVAAIDEFKNLLQSYPDFGLRPRAARFAGFLFGACMAATCHCNFSAAGRRARSSMPEHCPASSAAKVAEVNATRTTIDRVEQHFAMKPARLASRRGIAPHVYFADAHALFEDQYCCVSMMSPHAASTFSLPRKILTGFLPSYGLCDAKK
jgi:hypothetical protein